MKQLTGPSKSLIAGCRHDLLARMITEKIKNKLKPTKSLISPFGLTDATNLWLDGGFLALRTIVPSGPGDVCINNNFEVAHSMAAQW
jgi:hypothetical protein